MLVMLANGSALADTTFTAASGRNCKDESKPELGLWTCPGPAGYATRFTDEGNMVSFTLAPTGSMANAGPTAQGRGAGKAFGDKVQWIIRGGVPRAAVIRTWRRADDDDREIQELPVFTIDGKTACTFAGVDIHQPNANDLALAGNFPACLELAATGFGAPGPLGPVAAAGRQDRHVALEVRHDGESIGITHQDLEYRDLKVHPHPPLSPHGRGVVESVAGDPLQAL